MKKIEKNRTSKAKVQMMEAAKRLHKILEEQEADPDKAPASAFQDLIAPAMAAMDMVSEMDLPKIDFNELFTNVELDVSEDELDPETGLEESVKIAMAEGINLNEVAGGKPALRRYLATLASGESPDKEGFETWAASEGIELGTITNSWFNQSVKDVTKGGTVNLSAKASPAAEEGPDPDYVPSENLQKLIAQCEESGEDLTSAASTVRAKYLNIERKLKRVIRDASYKNYYHLFGDAGIGKSVIVNDCLAKCGKEVVNDLSLVTDTMKQVPLIKGDIGRSRSDVARFLWDTKDLDLVILDDCDSVLKKDVDNAVANMLKGAFDPDGHTVHISASIQKKANSYVMEENAKEARLRKMIEAKRNPEDYDEDADDDNYDTDEEGMLNTNDGVISELSWNYPCRIIFVSNLTAAQCTPAVFSRMDYFELHLTQEEYMVRLADIIDDMKFDNSKTGWSDQQVKEAKATAVLMMSNAIEAANHHIPLFGTPVKFSHALEFRIIRDLVENFLILVDAYVEERGLDPEDAKLQCIPEFVRTVLLPKL